MAALFDKVIDRKNTNCIKYDFASERGMPEGVLPLWVADMDFRSPPCVIEALTKKSRHGIFGYSDSKCDYFEVLHRWFFERFGWETEAEWLVKTPGVVYAICTAIRAFTQPGDSVLIQPPVYYPFSRSILENGRSLVENRLVYGEGGYAVDFADFEEKIIRQNVKLFILCSPHNPVGRVWKKEELTRMGDICAAHGVILLSDEIHADFVYPGHEHLVFAGLKPAFSKIAVTATAPTKTFNLAGLQVSNIFIADAKLRKAFKQEISRGGYSQPNVMGIVACQAAYEGGGEWLAGLREYLGENLDFLRGFLQKRLPKIKLVEPEGTFLVWLDCRELGLNDRELDRLMVHEAGLWLDGGTMFGPGGEGFQRVNIACPRSILKKALMQLHKAVKGLV